MRRTGYIKSVIQPKKIRKKMKEMIDCNSVVSEILEKYPDTLSVFLEWKLDCLGCAMSTFCSVQDVADDYHIDSQTFLAALQNVISDPKIH
jgi:hybrid cluster-associated redox disulfide protein